MIQSLLIFKIFFVCICDYYSLLLLYDYFSCYLDALQMGASQFEQSAGALKRKFWWKNLKVRPIWYVFLVTIIIMKIYIQCPHRLCNELFSNQTEIIRTYVGFRLFRFRKKFRWKKSSVRFKNNRYKVVAGTVSPL